MLAVLLAAAAVVALGEVSVGFSPLLVLVALLVAAAAVAALGEASVGLSLLLAGGMAVVLVD